MDVVNSVSASFFYNRPFLGDYAVFMLWFYLFFDVGSHRFLCECVQLKFNSV